MSLTNKLFLRILLRNREVYLLKISSLVAAFTSCILIILFALNEYGYDKFYTDHGDVFRLIERNNDPGYSGNRLSNRIPPAVLDSFKLQYSESVSTGRVKLLKEINAVYNSKTFSDQTVYAIDPEILRIFSVDFIDGSPEKFNNDGYYASISASTANAYFGKTDVAGETLSLYTNGDSIPFVVSTVFSDFPENSHQAFHFFISYNEEAIERLKFDPADAGVYGRKSKSLRFEPRIKSGTYSYQLQPIDEIYFGPRILGEDAQHGDRYSINILIFIVSMIFLLAVSTYTNLTTLTLPDRAKELAVKKLSGSSLLPMTISFLRESFTLVCASLAISLIVLGFMDAFITAFLSIDLKSLIVEHYWKLASVIILLCLFVITGPVLIFLRFISASPVRLLTGHGVTFPKLKQTIIFLQLGISMLLIVTSVVTRRQVDYSLIKEPGQSNDQIVYMPFPKGLTHEQLVDLRTNWSNGHIVDIIATSKLPNKINSRDIGSGFYFMKIEPGFKDFFNLEVVRGNWFKANDGDSITVINEEGARHLSSLPPETIGVFRNMEGLFDQPEKPIRLRLGSFDFNYLCIKVLEVDIRHTVRFLENYFEYDGAPPAVSFLNKRFEHWLDYQDRLNSLSLTFTIMSLALACCAIYGLTISIVRDKLKYIAIHKLCGASVLHITVLLVKEFAFQTFMSVVFFGPVTFLILAELLRTFVFSTRMTIIDFLMPVLYVCAVVFLLCGYQALTLNRTDLSSSLKD